MRQRYKGYHRVSYKGRVFIVKNRKTNAPQWAQELAAKVVKENSHKKIPVIQWRKRQDFHSTGVTYTIEGRIVIRQGTDEQDQRLVLLHELAHYLCPKACGHNMRFWITAFTLYYKYDINEEYAVKRERTYKLKATRAYEHLKSKNLIWKGGEIIHEKS